MCLWASSTYNRVTPSDAPIIYNFPQLWNELMNADIETLEITISENKLWQEAI